IGAAMIALHNAIMPWLVNHVPLGSLGPVVYGIGPVEGTPLLVLYSIIPWIGVMAAGYWFGTVLILEPARRNRLCLRLGLGATALFLILRGTNVYGDPRPWTSMQMPRLLAFLNTSKRSEEHTSELQSLAYLVCRLLLEKKKKT